MGFKIIWNHFKGLVERGTGTISRTFAPQPAHICTAPRQRHSGWIVRAGWLAPLLLAVTLLASTAHGEPLRCGHGIAATGDTAEQVHAKCGEPAQQDQWRTQAGVRQSWLYNFGSDHLLSRISFLDGRVSVIESSGFGFDPQHRDTAACLLGRFTIGESRAAILSRCGEPHTRSAADPKPKATGIHTERFEYASSTQIHILSFENGQLTQVHSHFR